MTHIHTQSDPPLPSRQTLPTMYDLPSENPEEPGLADEFHFLQPLLLFLTFLPTTWNPEMVFSACDLNLYYDINHLNWYKRPDWFGVVGVPRLDQQQDLRLSYVTWQEQANPFVVIELLSPGTEDEDLGRTVQKPGNPPTKWQVYEQILKVPYYIIFSRYTNQLQAFRLVSGLYEPVQLTEGRLLIPELGLSLGLWQGTFENIQRLWLRWFTISGELILTPDQQVAIAQQQAIIAEQRAIIAETRAAQLAAQLRELGIEPEDTNI